MTQDSEAPAAGSAMPVTRTVAVEARRLGLECVTQKAPRLIVDHFRDEDGKSCALGWVLRRSGGAGTNPWIRFYELRDELFPLLTPEQKIEVNDLWKLVMRANNEAMDADRRAAVVFPLLALADALEASAASARSAT